MPIAMISGHRDLTQAEFNQHYIPLIERAIARDCDFVIGDARGADAFAQAYLAERLHKGTLFKVTVYHAGSAPRHNIGSFPTRGGYVSYPAKDEAMTAASDFDIAWVRPGRESSGTGRNLIRRKMKGQRA